MTSPDSRDACTSIMRWLLEPRNCKVKSFLASSNRPSTKISIKRSNSSLSSVSCINSSHVYPVHDHTSLVCPYACLSAFTRERQTPVFKILRDNVITPFTGKKAAAHIQRAAYPFPIDKIIRFIARNLPLGILLAGPFFWLRVIHPLSPQAHSVP